MGLSRNLVATVLLCIGGAGFAPSGVAAAAGYLSIEAVPVGEDVERTPGELRESSLG